MRKLFDTEKILNFFLRGEGRKFLRPGGRISKITSRWGGYLVVVASKPQPGWISESTLVVDHTLEGPDRGALVLSERGKKYYL